MHFFLIFFKFLFVLGFFYFLGKTLRSFISLDFKKEMFETFFNVLLGLLFSTILYSFFKTNLRTSLVVSFPLIIYFCLINKIKFKFFLWKRIYFRKEILPLIVLALIVFIYQAISYFDFTTFQVKYLFVDNYTYANVVSVLHDFGVENVDYALNKYEPAFRHESMPYRYADLWMSSFIMDLVQVSDIESFYLISLPVLISLSGYFYYSILVERTSNIVKSILISIVLLFVSIAFIPVLNSGEKLPFISETSIMGTFQQKLSFSAIFFLLGIYFWKLKRENALLFFMFVPIFYVAYLPAIWGGIFVYLTIQFIKSKWKVSFTFYHIRLLFLLAFVLLFYWLFYKINGNFFLNTTKSNILDIPLVKRLPKEILDPNIPFRTKSFLSNLFYYSIPEIFMYLKGAVGNLIIGALFFLPIILLNYSKFKFYFSEVKFISIILLVGLVFTILKDGDYNNYQFFTNNLLLIGLVISLSFIHYFKENLFNYLFLLMLIFVNVLPVFSFKNKISKLPINHGFITDVNRIISRQHEKAVFCFANAESFDDSFYSWVGGNVLLPVKQIKNENVFFVLANPDVFFEKHSNSDLDYSFYWNLIPNWKKNNSSSSVYGFIKNNGIKCFLFYPNTIIPDDIKVRIKNVLVFKGYKFVEISLLSESFHKKINYRLFPL